MVMLAAGFLGSVAVRNVWVLALQNEGQARSMADVSARGDGPVQKKASPLGTNDVAQLMEGLSKRDSLLETAYIEIYSEIPEAIREWLPEMYPSAIIRMDAAALVGWWGRTAKPAVPALERLLKDDLADSNAALSLGLIGPDAKEAIPALITAVNEHRPFAATALGKMGRAAVAARPALEAVSENGPEWQRRESRMALKRIGEHLTARN